MSDSPEDSSVAAILEAAAAPVKPGKVKINARTGGSRSPGINWAAAFVLFCKGMSLDEIAGQFGCQVVVLQKRHRSEDWGALAAKSRALVAPAVAPSDLVLSAEETEKKARRIEQNRESALSVSQKLRARIEEAMLKIDQRADAIARTLREWLEKTDRGDDGPKAPGRMAVVAFFELVKEWDYQRVGDILALAKSAKLVDEASMTALGDVAQKGGNLGNPSSVPTYIINLPGVASQPRMKAADRVLEIPATTKAEPASSELVDPEPPPPIDPPGAPEVDPPYQLYESDGQEESEEVVEVEIISPNQDDSKPAPTVGDTIDFEKL